MDKYDILAYLKKEQPYFYETFGMSFVGLFGSFSRGDTTKESDIDILYTIDQNKKLSMFKYLKIAKILEEYFHKKVDLVRVERLKPKIKAYIEKDIIYV